MTPFDQRTTLLSSQIIDSIAPQDFATSVSKYVSCLILATLGRLVDNSERPQGVHERLVSATCAMLVLVIFLRKYGSLGRSLNDIYKSRLSFYLVSKVKSERGSDIVCHYVKRIAYASCVRGDCNGGT